MKTFRPLTLHKLKTFIFHDSRGQPLKENLNRLERTRKEHTKYKLQEKDRRQHRSIENTVYTWTQSLIGKFCFIRQCKVFNLGRGKSQ